MDEGTCRLEELGRGGGIGGEGGGGKIYRKKGSKYEWSRKICHTE